MASVGKLNCPPESNSSSLCSMAMVNFPRKSVSPKLQDALLDLVDRLDYIYARIDGTYSCDQLVADKLQYIHKLAKEARPHGW